MNIPDKELYREIILNKGMFAGTYKVYWNKFILQIYEPDAHIMKWGDCWDAQAGMWIESMDGTCLQVLKIREHYDKGRLNPRHFKFFRFPLSTVYVRKQPNGEIKYREFYGNFMTASKSTQRLQPIGITGMENQKIRFANLIMNGINPIKAYQTIFPYKVTTEIHQLHRRINILMADEVVIQTIKDQLTPFLEKMDKQFTDEELVTEIKSLLQGSIKGTPAHRDNIQFVLSIMGKMPQNAVSGSSRKLRMVEIEETGPPQ